MTNIIANIHTTQSHSHDSISLSQRKFAPTTPHVTILPYIWTSLLYVPPAHVVHSCHYLLVISNSICWHWQCGVLSPSHICMHCIISTLWSLAQSVNTAVGPCLCMYGALIFLYLYAAYYSYIIIIDSICQHRQEPSAPACVCMVLCFSYMCIYPVISLFYSLIQSFNTGRSRQPLPVCVWYFVFLIFVCILLFLHYNHWLNPSTQGWAFGPCLCFYGALIFLHLYASYCFYILIIDSMF